MMVAAPAWAQAPFSVINLQAHVTGDIGPSQLHPNWQSGRGGALGITMPFYAGDFEVGATVHRYAADTDVPGFAALWIYAGWGAHYTWQNRVSVSSTARLGNYRMSFDPSADAFDGGETESELVASVGGGLSLRVIGPLSIRGRIDRLYVQTYPALKMWYASVGLSVHIQAGNGWINFFK